MFSRSIITLFFALAALFVFVSAAPVVAPDVAISLPLVADIPLVGDLAQRDAIEVDVVAKILVDLKASVEASVKALDGINDPSKAVLEIVAAIKVAVEAFASVHIDAKLFGAKFSLYVDICLSIFLCIAINISKYGLFVFISIAAKIDASLSAFVSILISLLGPSFKLALAAAVKASADVLVGAKLFSTLAKIL